MTKKSQEEIRFWTERDGKYYYEDKIFNREVPFTLYELGHYKIDRNAKMLEFASLMKDYYDAHSSYPNIAFDRWVAEEQAAVRDLYSDLELDDKFFNESDEEKAIDLLIKKYKFDHAAGKAPDVCDYNIDVTRDFIKYIFENVEDWTRGMYAC
jgi:hypothetical protein